MKKKTSARSYSWILIIAALAGLGYYAYIRFGPNAGHVAPTPIQDTGDKTEPAPPAEDGPAPSETAQPGEVAATPVGPTGASDTGSTDPGTPHSPQEGHGTQVVRGTIQAAAPPSGLQPSDRPEEPGGPSPSPRDSFCASLAHDMDAFFSYLDHKAYIRRLEAETDTRLRFAQILRRMAAHPPMPAGEGLNPAIILQNIYHFYHVLNREDLRLIKQIITHERDEIEIHTELLFRWFTSEETCADAEGIKPSQDVLYHYAGFFLNTTGGRAALFRRAAAIRLLVSYYSISIIHAADKAGRNNFGIDVVPFIGPLKEEMGYYGSFLYQDDYMTRLEEIETYYLAKR